MKGAFLKTHVLLLCCFGPAVTKTGDKYFAGAYSRTNNTAEPTATCDFLLWLGSKQYFIEDDAPVFVHTDSKYLLGMIFGKF